VTLDFPEPLLDLELAAWEEIQARRLTVATALAVRDGIDQYVAERAATGEPVRRIDVELGLKARVRYRAEG
jgi:hypothetical protein